MKGINVNFCIQDRLNMKRKKHWELNLGIDSKFKALL